MGSTASARWSARGQPMRPCTHTTCLRSPSSSDHAAHEPEGTLADAAAPHHVDQPLLKPTKFRAGRRAWRGSQEGCGDSGEQATIIPPRPARRARSVPSLQGSVRSRRAASLPHDLSVLRGWWRDRDADGGPCRRTTARGRKRGVVGRPPPRTAFRRRSGRAGSRTGSAPRDRACRASRGYSRDGGRRSCG